MALPPNLAAEVRRKPAEKLVVALLREAMAPLQVVTKLPANPPAQFVLVRRVPGGASSNPDSRINDAARLRISAYATGTDAVEDARDLSLLIEQAFEEADGNWYTKAGLGTLVAVEMLTDATNAPGWDDVASDFVDLPSTVARYAATYLAVTRLPA